MAGNDTVYGGGGNDTILGGNIAEDTIFGGAGDDLIRAFTTTAAAGTAADFLSGGGGDDVVLGGAGNDTIEGGRGNDTLSGGGGNNSFVYDLGTPAGHDLITDFNPFGDVVRLANAPAGFDPLAALTDGAAGAVLDLGDGSNITFLGRLAREFDAGDFLIA